MTDDDSSEGSALHDLVTATARPFPGNSEQQMSAIGWVILLVMVVLLLPMLPIVAVVYLVSKAVGSVGNIGGDQHDYDVEESY